MTTLIKTCFPIRRPYTPLFMSLRDRINRLIERMENETVRLLPPTERPMVSEKREACSPGLILGRIDWDAADIVLTWAVNIDDPTPAERSPTYVLGLAELKQIALDTPNPRDCFESYALFLLSEAQHFLGDFFRDGPTDDIPLHRHMIFAQGLAGEVKPIRIHAVMFTFDEQHA